MKLKSWKHVKTVSFADGSDRARFCGCSRKITIGLFGFPKLASSPEWWSLAVASLLCSNLDPSTLSNGTSEWMHWGRQLDCLLKPTSNPTHQSADQAKVTSRHLQPLWWWYEQRESSRMEESSLPQAGRPRQFCAQLFPSGLENKRCVPRMNLLPLSFNRSFICFFSESGKVSTSRCYYCNWSFDTANNLNCDTFVNVLLFGYLWPFHVDCIDAIYADRAHHNVSLPVDNLYFAQ